MYVVSIDGLVACSSALGLRGVDVGCYYMSSRCLPSVWYPPPSPAKPLATRRELEVALREFDTTQVRGSRCM